ncbi:vWA domain-containing protein [Parendozoicomonas haliclonae]|uniref:Photosystem I assembly protein Ycf3 n=1 Tax=Parendozoicomonas haliclonae TaxID=1960125 RepID=A0A1X7AMP8_9GAMM|nr:VWA domain-containing protein [Parendozoicomonas haliclonae]SMA49260.1 photosystem I assembly protein Ycf3 [Parendozoicomonas haliclonae]
MTMIENFHFLRPLWLLALAPLALVIWQLWQSHTNKGSWQTLIPAHLLEHLLEGEEQTRSRWPALVAAIAGIIAIVAMAGPAWKQIETPVEKSVAPLVIVVDLSRSMLAADPAPNRLTRAKQKLTDILRQRQDGLTAIVAYAGSSHVVSPLTDDNATLTNLVRALDPSIMPVQGSQPQQGVAKAIELLRQGSGQAGSILLITDGLTEQQSKAIESEVSDSGDTLSILGIGSENGAPVPAEGGGFMRDAQGGIVMAQLERNLLQSTARASGGRYSDLTLDNSDITRLLPKSSALDATQRVDRNFDSWYDEGRWLTLLLIPLVLVGFRRGLILPLLLVSALGLHSPDSLAEQQQVPANKESVLDKAWSNAWETPDQQGQALLQQGNSAAAAARFDNPQWKAEALDQAGQYAEAASLFGEQAKAASNPMAKADAFYNQGNALARAGELQKSLDAYKEALKANPDMEQARTNQKIVEELKQQQQNQQNQNQDNNQQQNSDQQDKSENNSEEQSGDQQGSEQKQDDSGSQQKNESADQGKDQPSDKNQSQNSDSADQQNQQNDSEQQGEQDQEQDASSAEQGQNEEEQADSESQQSQATTEPSDETGKEQQAPVATEATEQDMDAEQTEAWLRRIPNDPGGLLRRKFEQQQKQMQQKRQHAPQDTQPW